MLYDKKIEVGGHEYHVQQFVASTAVKNFTRLFKLIGVPVSMAAGSLDQEADSVFPKMIQALAEKADEDEVLTLIKDLMKCAHVEGLPVSQVFDTHFQGRFNDLFLLLKEILVFQYGDFFSGLLSKKGQVEALKKKSKSPNT